jgi:hypothetical protein
VRLTAPGGPAGSGRLGKAAAVGRCFVQVERADWTFINTRAALDAFILLDHSDTIHHTECLDRANAHAIPTSRTQLKIDSEDHGSVLQRLPN